MSDEYCEFCLAGSGPLLERSRPYDGCEGRVLESTAWTPYAKAVELEDGWVAIWEHLASDAVLVCPFHANGKTVPRAPGTAIFGGVAVNLQEFDYVGERGDVVMFKHIKTWRYMNLREVGPTAVAVNHEGGELVYRPVSEALRSAAGRDLGEGPASDER